MSIKETKQKFFLYSVSVLYSVKQWQKYKLCNKGERQSIQQIYFRFIHDDIYRRRILYDSSLYPERRIFYIYVMGQRHTSCCIYDFYLGRKFTYMWSVFHAISRVIDFILPSYKCFYFFLVYFLLFSHRYCSHKYRRNEFPFNNKI